MKQTEEAGFTDKLYWIMRERVNPNNLNAILQYKHKIVGSW